MKQKMNHDLFSFAGEADFSLFACCRTGRELPLMTNPTKNSKDTPRKTIADTAFFLILKMCSKSLIRCEIMLLSAANFCRISVTFSAAHMEEERISHQWRFCIPLSQIARDFLHCDRLCRCTFDDWQNI
jgi:hypothetical protein